MIADPLVLDRVLSDLVGNACRHGAAPVTVRAEINDRHLRISVEDRGEGVSEDLAPRIFDRFERGGGEGSELGLAIAKAYARAHGGDVVYESRERGGARFELVLPRLEARASGLV